MLGSPAKALSRGGLDLVTKSAGTLGGAGTSSKYHTMAGASKSALSFYITTADTADSNRTLYARLKLTGVGGGGEAIRSFATIGSTAHVAARGLHSSLSFTNASATVSGEAQAIKGTFHVPNGSATVGTAGVVQAEAYSDGSSSAIGSGTLAFFQATLSGNATGAASLNDVMSLFSITTPAVAAGDMVLAGEDEPTWENSTYKIRCKINGTAFYLIATAA